MTKLIILVLVGFGGLAAAQPAPDPAPAASDAAALRKTCADAMNADPTFAKAIVATADKLIDAKTIAAHEQAARQIQENEQHVIYAYAAMWIFAALFVAVLWSRQQALKAMIAALRRDLEAAAKDSK